MDFEPTSWRKNSARRRRRRSEFVRKNGRKSVGRASRVPLSRCFCIFFYKTGVSLRLSSNLLYQKFLNDESPTTASLRSATPKKNVPCFSDFARDHFFLKMERTFFFGVLPSKYSGSVAGLQYGLGFAKTIFWGKGFGKTSTDFPARRKGSGE